MKNSEAAKIAAAENESPSPVDTSLPLIEADMVQPELEAAAQGKLQSNPQGPNSRDLTLFGEQLANIDEGPQHESATLNLRDLMSAEDLAQFMGSTEAPKASLPTLVLDLENDERREEVLRTEARHASGSPSSRQLMVLMERPFFSLAKRRTSVAEYVSRDGQISIRVEPGPAGMATIYDADVIMFLVDRLSNSEIQVGRHYLLQPSEYFAAVGSTRGGDQYKSLRDSIERLRTTRVETNAQPNGKPGPMRTFLFIEEATRVADGWRVRLADWLEEGARSKFKLSICAEYFALPGFERFLYLTARKHVGRDPEKHFRVQISTLWKKSGSAASLARFKYEMRRRADSNRVPEYGLQWEEPSSRGQEPQVIFSRSFDRS